MISEGLQTTYSPSFWRLCPLQTNTVEGYFSIFKRGMKGIYQHCGEQHLHRYLAEYEFRYNNRIANGVDDRQRADAALTGITGKRLTYRSAYEQGPLPKPTKWKKGRWRTKPHRKR
jgi:ISXO2-like transposase domain